MGGVCRHLFFLLAFWHQLHCPPPSLPTPFKSGGIGVSHTTTGTGKLDGRPEPLLLPYQIVPVHSAQPAKGLHTPPTPELTRRMHKPAGYQRPQASNTHIIKQARTKSLWAREPCAKHLGQCTRLDAMERGSYSSSPGPAHPRAPNGTTTTPDRPPRPSSRQCATWHTQHISRYGRAWRGLRGWPRPLCTQ